MKKIILLVVLALLGVITWYFWETKPKPDKEVNLVTPIKASQHSTAFNSSIDSVLNTYYTLSERLVAWDSTKIIEGTKALQLQLGKLNLAELQQDSAIHQEGLSQLKTVQKHVELMASANGLGAKKRAFHNLSQNMFALLKTIQYDAQKVYLQECPMAFNDDETGNWISNTENIRNPYLGLHHPKYKGGMLECGEVKDSLKFEQVQ